MPPRIPLKRLTASLAVIFLTGYYAVLIFSAKPQAIQEDLVRSFETATNGSFRFSRFRLLYFPVLQTEFSGVELQANEPAVFTFKAERLKIHFSFWAFLFARAEISEISIDGGQWHLPAPSRMLMGHLDIHNIRLRIRWNPRRRQALAQGEGDLEGVSRSLSGRGTFGGMDFKERDWQQSFFDGDLFLKNFPAAQFHDERLRERNIVLKEGNIAGQAHFHKEGLEPQVQIQGKAALAGFVYEVQDDSHRLVSPPMDIQADSETEWNPAEEQLLIQQAGLAAPFGKLQAAGKFFLATRELQGMRVRLSEVLLESIPQYYLPFKEAVPFNFGFSGRSDLEMVLQGTPDHLTIHANWDLTPSLLTYAGTFSKPKDMPLNLVSECLLKDGHRLSGDFSLKIQEMGLKGALADLDLRTGEGQLNLMTNKFKLRNWTALLPPFQGYTLDGGIKILANFDGNLLERPGEVKSMVNMTLEDVHVSRGESALRNLSMVLDYSPISIEIKEGQVQVEDQTLFFNGMVYDPVANPRAKAKLTSPKLDMAKFLAALEGLGRDGLPKKPLKRLQRAHETVAHFLPPGQTVDELAAEIEIKDLRLFVHRLHFKVDEGTLQLKGEWDFTNQSEITYQLQSEIDRLNLARFFSRGAQKQQLIQGNFFLKGDFQGKNWGHPDWKESLTGKGVLSVTNGEFSTFSILEAVADIQGFSILMPSASEVTPFDDVRAEFQVAEGKVITEKASLLSRDFKASADGEVTLDGLMNYRLNVFLSYPLAKDILEPILENPSESQEDSFGPIPLLLSGTLERPILATDPSKLAELKDNLTKKKVQKVLRHFLPEEALFKRLKSP